MQEVKRNEKKTILAGVDGTDASYKAVWWAANYAVHANLDLQIVCVCPLINYAAVTMDSSYITFADDTAAKQDAQLILAKAKAIAKKQGANVETLLATGDPTSVFVELSRNYRLIVIGNRKKGGLAERLLDAPGSNLPAHVYCPVVVVPYLDAEGKRIRLNNKIENVAVGSDESVWGLKALEIAAEYANEWGAKLSVVSAVSIPAVSGGTLSAADIISDREMDDILNSYREELEERIEPLKKKYPDLQIEAQVVQGTAHSALTEASEKSDAVVVGSRGRSGFTGLLIGSVSQDLVQHSVAPVYVVPKKYVDFVRDENRTDESGKAESSNVSIDEIIGLEKVEVEPAQGEAAEAVEEAIKPDEQ